MGKRARKRQRVNNDTSPSTLASKILKKHQLTEHTKSLSGDEDETSHTHGISDEALNITIVTLQRLCESSDSTSQKPAVKDKRYRNLRRVLYDLQNSLGGAINTKTTGQHGIGTFSHSSIATNFNSSSFSKVTNEITKQIEHGAWDNVIVTLRNLRRIHELQRLVHQTLEEEAVPHSNFDYRPKLGALQRWVREIDAAGTGDPLALEVLDAILRVVAPECLVSIDESDTTRASWANLGVNMGEEHIVTSDFKKGRIRLFPAFGCLDAAKDDINKQDELSLHDKGDTFRDFFDDLVANIVCGADGIHRLLDTNTISREDCFRICGHEDGPDRKPPNKYDLDLVTTSVINEHELIENKKGPATMSSYNVLFERDLKSNPVKKTPIPYVNDTFLLENVFSPIECDRLIAAAELAGYFPDEPLGGQPGASILAHACVWIIDHHMERTIFHRVKEFLPKYRDRKYVQFQNSCRDESDLETFYPLGINRRFRFYRYVPGRYYRPHIDGAWPSSGFDINGDYRYDINNITNKNGMQFVQSNDSSKIAQNGEPKQSSRRPQLSRLTFLIYLNDNFEGGNTTFFIPAKEQEGVLNAFPVKPSRGCVLVFPHGTCTAPLHEGSPVLKGCKYVVRTEVEYYV